MQDQIAVPVAASRSVSHDIQASSKTLSPVEKQRGGRDAAPTAGLELIELELALDSVQSERGGFGEAVGAAVRSLGGEFLFSLPASGLAEGQQKIAVVRLPGDAQETLVFVFLSEDGTRTTVRLPDEETAGLANFSRAFIGLLEKL